MHRRSFLSLLGGAAAAWPLAAQAQHRERVRRVGVLMNLAAGDPEGQVRLAVFLQGLAQLGWTVERNVQIDIRCGSGEDGHFRTYAQELVALAPDVLFAASGATMPALRQATRTIPIVFAQTIDPVGAGLVASLARPGGNVTGFTQFELGISAKWLELLMEIAPSVRRTGVLRNATDTGGLGQFGAIQSVAPSLVLN
jgi:putative ABC transport system substrate-binding protein